MNLPFGIILKMKSRFVKSRLNLYRKGMQDLGFGESVQFLRSKAKLLSEAIRKRDVFRGDPSEFNQKRVYDTNLSALLRYRYQPLRDRGVVVEIFRSQRVIRKGSVKSRVDWNALVAESTRHKVPGRDSGDMLRGHNVRALARILSDRLLNARRS